MVIGRNGNASGPKWKWAEIVMAMGRNGNANWSTWFCAETVMDQYANGPTWSWAGIEKGQNYPEPINKCLGRNGNAYGPKW